MAQNIEKKGMRKSLGEESSYQDVLNKKKAHETEGFKFRQKTLIKRQEMMRLSISITEILYSKDFFHEE